jgi:hypothetical protein
MQTSININIKKVAKQIACIDEIAKKNSWVYSYDEDIDCLYYSPEKIDESCSLLSLDNEFTMYIDKDSNLEGIFIEYYKSNLASHDEKFKEFANIFTKKNNHVKGVADNKKNKLLLLSETIKAEMLSNIIKCEYDEKTAFIIPA